MPYIVTVKNPPTSHPGEVAAIQQKIDRRAVATLKEARELVHDTLYRWEDDHSGDDGRLEPLYNLTRNLPESGGTIGPLPDGTVIEVEEVEWAKLAKIAEADTDDHDVILDAFNALGHTVADGHLGIPYALVEADRDGWTRTCPVCGEHIVEAIGSDGEITSNNYAAHYRAEHMPSTHVYVVNVFDRTDGLYVFANRDDAEAFERAVNASYDQSMLAAGLGAACILDEQPVNRGDDARQLIEEEMRDD